MNSNNTVAQKIHIGKLETMKIRIIDLERQNLKIKAYTENDMLEEIRKIIIEESNKN
ncbi:hypothetical protein [Lysinibacillus capsici]|uniref:hypothetical protein n=1 Tax=Lysinibacillus capsici TaxID=2115968 RepID=UPI0027312C79|nr:hypothetical protein [Lysinibacillus capsici]